MLWYELADIMFLVKCIKNPDSRLKISKYITFCTTTTRSISFLKLSHHHHSRTNLSRHFYFNRVCRLWNALPPIDLNLSSNTIKANIKYHLWSLFVEKFNQHNYYLFLSLCISMCQMFVATSANQLFSMSVAVIFLFGYYIYICV